MHVRSRTVSPLISDASVDQGESRGSSRRSLGGSPNRVDSYRSSGASQPVQALRPSFLERPVAQDANPTWRRMTESRGTVFDVRMEGRGIEAHLLDELARYGRDPMPSARVAAELAGAEAIRVSGQGGRAGQRW